MTNLFPGDDRTNLERMRAGEEYIADDEIAELAFSAQRLAFEYPTEYFAGAERARSHLLRMLGSFGAGSEIRPSFQVDYGTNLHIGDGVFINFNLVALDVAPITIGDGCMLGPNVQLLTPTHPLDPERRAALIEGSAPIVLEENVWLGGGVIVLPGVTIGRDSVIGAGAVVTRDVPPRSVAVGNPATVVRAL